MTPTCLKEYLLKILVAFTKRIKTMKLSIRHLLCAYRPLLELLRRLLHGISHKFGTFPESKLRVDSIIGATQPMQNDTPVTHSGIPGTLAVRTPENFLENVLSSHRPIGITMSIQMPMPLGHPNATITPHSSSAPGNVNGRGYRDVTLREIVATEIRRYKRIIAQSVLFVFDVLRHPSN